MKNLRHPGAFDGLYPWGKAELIGKWVILHKSGGPSWAIYYEKKKPKVAIPYNHPGMVKDSRSESGLARSLKST
jgi:hypothetical protein